MKLTGNTILITGGSEGIGRELAKALVADNRVIICGRSLTKLQSVKEEIPTLIVKQCDVTDAQQRDSVLHSILCDYPDLNILINNAGAKHVCDLSIGSAFEGALTEDMALNSFALVYLTQRLLPQLKGHKESAVINITTGLVHLPKAQQAFYCTAKAALHSYTQSLRWALRDTSVQVQEIALPLVDTNFHKDKQTHNISALSAKEVVGKVLRKITKQDEIYIGKACLTPWLSLFSVDLGMSVINKERSRKES